MSEMPANGGLLRIGGRSPDSQFGHFRSKIADSLRLIFEILPFSGDSDRRPGSIATAWRGLQFARAVGSFLTSNLRVQAVVPVVNLIRLAGSGESGDAAVR
jgi:hypothetical protein